MKKDGKELTPYEALDEILKALTINPSSNRYVTKDELVKFVTTKSSVQLSTEELAMVLDQLVEDGFVKAEPTANSTTPSYALTFKGQMLNLNGGYKYFSRDQERLYKLEIAHRETEKKLFYAIVVLALGALIASVFYVIRIYGLFHTGQ